MYTRVGGFAAKAVSSLLAASFVLSPLSIFAQEGEAGDEQVELPDEGSEQSSSAMAGAGSMTEAGSVFINNESTRGAAPQADTQTGALTYAYDIPIPPGRNGMTPELTLAYSSNTTGNTSAFGYGWSLSIPHITRLNKYGVDKLYSSSTFSSSLDGELVAVDATTYKPRVENGSFRQYTYANNVWTVREKDGTELLFGSTTQARRDDPANGSRIFGWYLEEARDQNGNYIEYEYLKHEGQIYPNRIVYTGHNTTDGIFAVDFTREVRPDTLVSYETGFLSTTTYRTSRIEASVSGSWTHRYDLGYSTGHNGNRSLLTSITRSGRDAQGTTATWPAMDFGYETYSSGDKDWSEDTGWYVPVDIIREETGYDDGARFVDINGDSLPDIIRSWSTNLYPWSSSTIEQLVYLNTGDAWATSTAWTLPLPYNGLFSFVGYDSYSGTQQADLGARFADVNEDGYTDILWGYYGSFSSTQGFYSYSLQDVYINNRVSGWATSSAWALPSDFQFVRQNADAGGRIADVNGDGLPDLLTARNNCSGGCTDINKVYLNTGNGWETASTTWQIPEPFLSGMTDVGTELADVNGDGLIDVVRSFESDRTGGLPDTHKVYLNTGSGWQHASSWTVPLHFSYQDSANGTIWGVSTRLTDVNGDGLVDLIGAAQNSSFIPDSNTTYINTGEGWVEDTAWGDPPYFKFGYSVNGFHFTEAGVAQMDADGDNMIDFVKSGPIYSHPTYPQDKGVYLNDAKVPDLLSSIEHPEGGEMSVAYEQSCRYEDASGRLNPKLPFNLNTVRTITSDDGIDSHTKTYTYGNGLLYFASSTDNQFAGFGTTTVADELGNTTHTYIHQGNASLTSLGEHADAFEKIGKPFLTEVYDDEDDLYARTIRRWESQSNGTSSAFVYQTRELTQQYDGDADHKDAAIEYTYDATTGNTRTAIEWGEVTGAADGTFSDTGSDKRTTAYGYATSTSPYMSLPSQETVTNQSGAKLRETKYYYDTLAHGSVSKGNVTKQELWKSGSSYIDIEKTYNSHGLVTEERDPRDKATTYAYDAFTLYPATTTNPLGHATAFQYDYSAGQVTQTVDPNGRVFQTIYDAFDRVKEEKQPDLAAPATLVTKSLYTYTDAGLPRRIQRTDYLSSGTSVDSYTHLDGFGRTIQERTEAEGGTFSVKDFTYDDDGLVETESLPYFSSGTSYTGTSSPAASSLLMRYAYDPLQRVKTIATSVGTTTNAYDQWAVTTTDPEGSVKELFKDAYGSLWKVVEHNGASQYTTLYEHDGNNKLTKITDADGNIRNFTYDGLGRRLAAQDLHDTGDGTFGTWTYAFDDAGNLASSTDPKSQIVEFTYDDLNRPLTENYTGAGGTEVSYGYDWCADGKGRLCSATTTDAVTNHQYNALGLLKKETKTLNAVNYVTEYAYDRLGNTTDITYPDGSQVAYSYNTAGLLEAITYKESGGTFDDLVTDFDYGPTGKVTYKAFANGTETTHTYDATKLYRLTNILTTADAGESFMGGGGGLGMFGSPDLAEFVDDLMYVVAPFESLMLDPIGEDSTDETAPEPDSSLAATSTEEVESSEEQIAEQSPSESASATSTPSETATSTPEEELELEEQAPDTASTTVPALEPDIVAPAAISASTTTAVQATSTEELPDVPWDAPHLKLKAPVERHLGIVNDRGVIIYAYRTDTNVDTLPASEEVAAKAKDNGLTILSEIVAKRTGNARTFATDQEGVFVTEIISGEPQYYRDETGEWWLANYATTTAESYEEQTKPREVSFVRKILSILGRVLGYDPTSVYATTSTFYPGSTVDGRVLRYTPGTFSSVRGGNGDLAIDNDAYSDITYAETNMSSLMAEIDRAIYLFDTSSIPDGDTIASASFSVYVLSTFNSTVEPASIRLVESNPASNTALSNSDYQGNVSYTTALASDKTVSSVTTSAYNTWNLNATGLTKVSRTGVTKLGLKTVFDAANTSPTIDGTKDQAGINGYWSEAQDTSTDPKLIVIHSAAATSPTSLLTEAQTNPTAITDPTPEFSAIYNDPDTSDIAVSYHIQVASSSAFTSTDWDSTKTTLASSTPQGTRVPDISYAGSSLTASTTYYWRIKFWDASDVEGAWSTATSTFVLAESTTSPLFIDTVQNISFAYDNVGNVTEITDHSESGTGKIAVFGYDDLHRLTSASTTAASSTPYRHTFAYSPIGNVSGMSTSTATTTYTYAETGYANPAAATSIGAATLAYDNNGNVTSHGSQSFVWDYRNRLTSAGSSATTTYAYDHTEQRVKKTTGGTTTWYPSDLYNKAGATTTRHVFDNRGGLIATVEGNGTATSTYYIHPDHLGGANAVTDANQGLVEATDYYPYGSQRIRNGPFTEQRKFTGHEYDSESDLTYAEARYYEQDIGRWLSQDPAQSTPEQFLSDPQQLNYYSYTRNNPLKYVDPNGEKLYEISGGITIGPIGGSIGFRYEPGVGRQFYTSSSIGVSFGASLKYDPEGTLDQTRPQGETYVERQLVISPIIGGFRSTESEENPFSPFSLNDNPKESSGWAFGLEAGSTHSFMRNGDITHSQNEGAPTGATPSSTSGGAPPATSQSSASSIKIPLGHIQHQLEAIQSRITTLATQRTQRSEE